MRRPPGREEQMTERQVATANDTLNTFVGGRQKSWMTGVQPATVRPSPRVGARAPIQVTAGSSSSVLPSPAPSDEPSPSASIQQTSPDPERSSRPTTGMAPTQTSQTSSLMRPSQLAATASNTQVESRVQDRTQATRDFQQFVGPRLGTWTVPSSRQASVVQPQVQSPRHVIHLNDSPVPRNNAPTLANRSQMIEQHIANIGGAQKLNQNLDLPRFKLLKDACEKDDYFYVVLHQVFCLWSFAPDEIDGKIAYCDNNTLAQGFRILGQLIKDNEPLDPANLEWFSNFPGKFAGFSITSKPYRIAVTKVGTFLSRMASEWARYNMQCNQRDCPPLVDEMVNVLSLTSPVLQQVVFTATRRNLNMRDDETGLQAEKLFSSDLEGHRHLASRVNTDRPPTQKEIEERNNYLISQYHKLRRRQLSSASNSPLSINTTGHSAIGNHQASNGSMGQAPSPSMTNLDSAGRFMNSPNLTNSGHSSPQIQQLAFQRTLPNGQALFVSQPPQPQSPFIQSPILQPGVRPILHNNVLPYPTQTYSLPSVHQPVQGQMYAPNGQNPVLWNQMAHPTPAHQDQTLRNSAAQQQQQQQQQQHINQQNWNHMRPQAQIPVAGFRPAPPARPGRPPHRGNIPNQPYSLSSYQAQLDNAGNIAHQLQPLSTGQIQIDMQSAFIPRLRDSFLPQAYLPDETALHQAHLKSPRLVPVSITSTSSDPNSLRCYQVITTLAMGPAVLSIPTLLTKYHFGVSNSNISKLPEVMDDFTRNVTNGTIQYRLRCIELKDAEPPTEAEWVVADTKWPRALFMDINGPGNPLELRYKSYHGKDLPINLTNYIRAHGSEQPNTLRVSIRRLKNDIVEKPYAIGVEVIQIMQHDDIVKRCLETQIIPANETVNKIKASLAGSTNDDDDVAIVASDLTIDLADPFMAKIFNIPARSKECLHRECFDLETFLITRSSKPNTTGQPSMVDVWKCPICAVDARPQKLFIDGFLVEVRKRLEEHDQLHFKAITVTSDGEWKPKPERQPSLKRREIRADSAGFRDIEDYDSEDENPIPMMKKARQESSRPSTSDRQGSEKREPELIVLDDSD